MAYTDERSTPESVNYESTINSPSWGFRLAMHALHWGVSRLEVFRSAKRKQIEK